MFAHARVGRAQGTLRTSQPQRRTGPACCPATRPEAVRRPTGRSTSSAWSCWCASARRCSAGLLLSLASDLGGDARAVGLPIPGLLADPRPGRGGGLDLVARGRVGLAAGRGRPGGGAADRGALAAVAPGRERAPSRSADRPHRRRPAPSTASWRACSCPVRAGATGRVACPSPAGVCRRPAPARPASRRRSRRWSTSVSPTCRCPGSSLSGRSGCRCRQAAPRAGPAPPMADGARDAAAWTPGGEPAAVRHGIAAPAAATETAGRRTAEPRRRRHRRGGRHGRAHAHPSHPHG